MKLQYKLFHLSFEKVFINIPKHEVNQFGNLYFLALKIPDMQELWEFFK